MEHLRYAAARLLPASPDVAAEVHAIAGDPEQPQLIEQVASKLTDAEVIVADDDDHLFKVPKRAEKTTDEVASSGVSGAIDRGSQ